MTDIVERLYNFCTDWDGSYMGDEAEPMPGLHCAELREAAAEITRLRKERGELISQFHHAMKDAGWHPGRTDDNLCDIIRAKGKLLAATEGNMEFYRNFAAEVLTIKRLPIPQDMDAMCRRAYDNQYHKIKADMGCDQWRMVWLKAIAAHESDPQYSAGPLIEKGWD